MSVPYLRFTRDRRGYEHISLVQDGRRKGRDRARILYVFRTPPGVRIGREAFDPDTLDLIERANPHLSFDWDAILEARPDAPEDEAPMRRERRRTAPAGASGATGDRRQPAAPMPTLDRVLGRDAAMRMRQRFAAVRQRVDEGAGLDPEQLAVCRARLAELDPDSWTGEETVRSRALGFDADIEELRRTLGLPKRRSRRNGRRDDRAGAPDQGGGSPDPDAPRTDATVTSSTRDTASRVDAQPGSDTGQPHALDDGTTPADH